MDVYETEIDNSKLPRKERKIAHVLLPILKKFVLDILEKETNDKLDATVKEMADIFKNETNYKLDATVREMEDIMKARFLNTNDQVIPTNDSNDHYLT